MGTNLALQKLYVELGALQNQISAVGIMAPAPVADVDSGIGIGFEGTGDDAESTGISTFRKISMVLQEQVCGNSEWRQAAKGAGLTEDKAKEVIAGIVASALGLGGAWPAIVAGIAVSLFFDTVAPKICAKWAAWNSNSNPNAYQADPVLDTMHIGG